MYWIYFWQIKRFLIPDFQASDVRMLVHNKVMWQLPMRGMVKHMFLVQSFWTSDATGLKQFDAPTHTQQHCIVLCRFWQQVCIRVGHIGQHVFFFFLAERHEFWSKHVAFFKKTHSAATSVISAIITRIYGTTSETMATRNSRQKLLPANNTKRFH